MSGIKYWFMKICLPIGTWTQLQGRGIVRNGELDKFVDDAINEKFERDDKLANNTQRNFR